MLAAAQIPSGIAAIFEAKIPYFLVRLGIGLYFLYAALVKFMDIPSFARTISEFGIVYPDFIMPVAVGLTLLEIVAAVALIFDLRGGLALVSCLLVLFMGILGYGVWLGLDIDCGCLGPAESHSLQAALGIDAVLLLLSGYLFACRRFQSIKPRNLFSNFRTTNKGD